MWRPLGRRVVCFVVVMAVAASLVGCGDDGGGPDVIATSTVQGNVATITAALPTEAPVSQFALLRTWFAFPTLAHA